MLCIYMGSQTSSCVKQTRFRNAHQHLIHIRPQGMLDRVRTRTRTWMIPVHDIYLLIAGVSQPSRVPFRVVHVHLCAVVPRLNARLVRADWLFRQPPHKKKHKRRAAKHDQVSGVMRKKAWQEQNLSLRHVEKHTYYNVHVK